MFTRGYSYWACHQQGRKQPEEWEKTVASEGFLLETPSDDTFFQSWPS
jgi:hypothetical protein